MSQRYNYTIKPLEGRQFIQRNFVTLPEKGFKYSNRAISLNERFSVIERGIYWYSLFSAQLFLVVI